MNGKNDHILEWHPWTGECLAWPTCPVGHRHKWSKWVKSGVLAKATCRACTVPRCKKMQYLGAPRWFREAEKREKVVDQ